MAEPLSLLDGCLRRVVVERCGFLDEAALRTIAAHDRLRPLLARFSEGRCTVPAQDAAGLIAAAERGGWHLRDLSLPVGDSAHARFRRPAGTVRP